MGRAPIYFDVNDYKKLGESLIRLINDPVLYKNQVEKIVKIPLIESWETIAKDTVNLYQNI
jgi:hypothetical protein